MIKTKIVRDSSVNACPNCHQFINPMGKSNNFHCGKYFESFHSFDRKITFDDGRSNSGQFHHAPAILSSEVTA